MTPEGSEPLEELPNSEEENSVAPSTSSATNNVQIRVKNVSEINSNEAEALPSPPIKRKLPSWMRLAPQNPNESATNKKAKIVSNEVNQNAATSSSRDDQSVSDEVDLPNSVSDLIGTTNDLGVQNAEVAATDDHEAETQSVSDSTCASTSTAQCSTTPTTAIKPEPSDSEDNGAVGQIIPASSKDIKPAVKVEKEEATSSTTRPTCRFGVRCYRQNPIHRLEEAHPGDKDYQRPNFPSPPNGTPACPYGDLCYRRNPVHFQQYSHPPSTDFDQNYKNYKMRLRKQKQPPADANTSCSDLGDADDDSNDFDDPFINDDTDDEFIPNTLDFEEDDDDDFL